MSGNTHETTQWARCVATVCGQPQAATDRFLFDPCGRTGRTPFLTPFSFSLSPLTIASQTQKNPQHEKPPTTESS
jgi:hypothetical protein